MARTIVPRRLWAFGLPALGDRARGLELALEEAGPQERDSAVVARRYEALRGQLRSTIGAP